MLVTTFNILVDYHQGFLQGLVVTFKLFFIIAFFGITIGGSLGWMSRRSEDIRNIVRCGAFFLSGIPILVFLMWMHYPFQAMLDIVVDPFYTACLTFTVVNIFSVADLVRKTLGDFPEQYRIAAKVCGLTNKQTIFKIELPLLFRQILPALIMLQVVMLHTTLFASLISVEEIFRVAQRINANIYKPVEIYTALGVFFLIICLPINGFAVYLKKKYTRNISER